jgi:hypothetical protein
MTGPHVNAMRGLKSRKRLTRCVLVVVICRADHTCYLLSRDDWHVDIANDHVEACRSVSFTPPTLYCTHGYCPL